MNFQSMTRRQVTLLGLSAMVAGSFAMAQTGGGSNSSAPTATGTRRVRLPDGSSIPALGMGSWRLGQGRRPIAQEEEAMRTGISLGMNLIDTAEMYGSGASEEMIGRVITGRRAEVFLVSKVLPSNATTTGTIRSACVNSLKRLGTDYLDLYLLHWRSQVRDMALLVDTFEGLKRDGLIRGWGVSNFDVSDMEELFSVAGGKACATNQVEYSLSSRSIERDLIPWSRKHGVPLMAYSPLGSDGRLLHNPALAEVASKHGVTPAAIAIAWTLRDGATISIPESGSASHIRENARAATLSLDAQDLALLELAFPV